MLAIFLISLFGLILINVPIALSLIGTAILLALFQGTLSSQIITQSLVRGVDSFPLLAIPFFMIAGELMNQGGISSRIVKFAHSLVGHIRGGIGYVAVVASMIFAGVSGSAVADTTAVGSVLLPIMKENGYDVPKSTALVSTAGCIGPIIPPSIPLILYGVIGEVSIVKLFLGGIVPGFLVGVSLMIAWYFHSKKANYKAAKRATFKQILISAKEAIWAIFLPVIILVGIVIGIVTPTEAAVVAVVYAFVVSKFIYKELKLSQIPEILINGAKSTAMIMFVVGGAMTAAYLITTAHIPELLTNTLLSLTDNVLVIMFLINIMLLLVGCVMDMGPAILILAPILLPLIESFGLDPIYFGVIMTVNLCIGLATPPVGNVLYAGCGLAKIPISQLSRAIIPFIAVMVLTLFIITYFPGLVMFIPTMIGN
ncbi:MAG: TRAP-type transport system large permease protein [Clostridiales bacterium]|jgi:tripartite ATP-independent transporter DctM subunit|nr:TRAP-type transport system large permease protein [Clostridiales bacterium]MDK2933030.1 TRAP-type transport system large permease protein [Clostridiales bacterium]